MDLLKCVVLSCSTGVPSISTERMSWPNVKLETKLIERALEPRSFDGTVLFGPFEKWPNDIKKYVK